MDYFFHADTSRYLRRFKGTVITVAVPLFGICVFCTVNILLNLSPAFSQDLLWLLAGVIAGCMLLGMAAVFAAAYITHKYICRHNRFTFLDILPAGFVFSVYAGEFRRYGEQVVLRQLYYVPFSSLQEIIRDGRKLTVKGEVRVFLYESDRLGYHVNEDGQLMFDSPELNERGFQTMESLEISGWFSSTKRVERSLQAFWEEYRNAPEKKPFNIADHITKKRKKRPQTSNPLLEAPSYDRKWDT